jgi:hypothetical protein
MGQQATLVRSTGTSFTHLASLVCSVIARMVVNMLFSLLSYGTHHHVDQKDPVSITGSLAARSRSKHCKGMPLALSVLQVSSSFCGPISRSCC